MAQFSLAWGDYKPHICQGLSALQQNGELVDMTLAADGYHVQVHRLVISLVSPYLKGLLDSAKCPHPVIFLNKISYSTLCSLLEYIYTGQTTVTKEQMPDLVQAAKELRIKGLDDMEVDIEMNPKQLAMKSKVHKTDDKTAQPQILDVRTLTTSKGSHFEGIDDNKTITPNMEENATIEVGYADLNIDNTDSDMDHTEEGIDNNDSVVDQTEKSLAMITREENKKANRKMKRQCDSMSYETTEQKKDKPIIQYTVTPLGSLQLIINRFMYFLRYTSRKGVGGEGHRQWRCVDYFKGHCPASVVTKDDVIVSRVAAHNHPFHDRRILRKVQSNCVFATLADAEIIGSRKKQKK